MNKEGCTREYVDIFPEYCPEKWRWSLKNTSEQSELYKKTRARQSGTNGEDTINGHKKSNEVTKDILKQTIQNQRRDAK